MLVYRMWIPTYSPNYKATDSKLCYHMLDEDRQNTYTCLNLIDVNFYITVIYLSSYKMLLVDPDRWKSSNLKNDVTSMPQRGLLPEPIEPPVSSLSQTPSDKDFVLFEPDPEDPSRSNSVVTSIPQRM